jgi:hypothetical protein
MRGHVLERLAEIHIPVNEPDSTLAQYPRVEKIVGRDSCQCLVADEQQSLRILSATHHFQEFDTEF